MRAYVVEQTSLECQWIFDRMLPSLPGPGTPAFARLVKALHAFGIEPSGVTVDAPSSRLSEVALGILLLERRVGVRITSTSFDLFVNALLVGDDVVLIQIANTVSDALREIDSDFDKASVKVRVSSHLSLQSNDIEGFLTDHLKRGSGRPELVPDALAYKVTSDLLHSSELRTVIAKSITFKSALFLDMNVTYPQAPDVASLAAWVSADFDTTLTFLGLTEAEQSHD